MMNEQEMINVLTIRFLDGIGDVNGRRLIEFFGSAGEALRQPKRSLMKVPGIGSVLAGKFTQGEARSKAEKELEFSLNNGIRVLTLGDPDYPENLSHCHDAPLVLFLKGNPVWKKSKPLSVVGTRMMTAYGRDFLLKFMRKARPFEPLIISGMAYGVDIYAHERALAEGLPTVGVLAHGLDTLYPSLHRKTAGKMMEKGGLITEFPSRTRPEKENFVRRNRLIAGISGATVVVESGKKGGSLITADLALSYHREVLAVPGRSTDIFSKGCNDLIRDHKAAMITCFQDLQKALNWDNGAKVEIQSKMFSELSENEQKVIDQLEKKEETDLDSLIISCEMPLPELSSILLKLELQGMVCRLPGKRFSML